MIKLGEPIKDISFAYIGINGTVSVFRGLQFVIRGNILETDCDLISSGVTEMLYGDMRLGAIGSMACTIADRLYRKEWNIID